MPIGEIAVLRVQLGFIGTRRPGQREIAADALTTALDRHVDAVGPPGLAALLVIDDDASAADSQPLQLAQRLVAVPAARQLLQHLGPEIVAVSSGPASRAVMAPLRSRAKCTTGRSMISCAGNS